MTSSFLLFSSPSRCLPTSSVASSVKRSPPAPPLEPLSLPTPPEPPDPPDPQICSSFGESLAQPLLRLHIIDTNRLLSSNAPSPSLSRSTLPCWKFVQQSLAAVTPHRVIRRRRCPMAILPRFLTMNLGFYWLGLCVDSLLGQIWMGLLRDHKRNGFLLGLNSSTFNLLLFLAQTLSHLISTLRNQPPHLIKRRCLLNLVVRRVDCTTFSIKTSLLPFPQGALLSRLFFLQKRGSLSKTVPVQLLLIL
ncbi:hypothetical protein CARUB_v10012783mg [Capsella rubella]|uniref:Uncharacterized protein n=1 Tax=Capsella rubella TaxID=81985 RepID=R0GI17_9BRAS|nr:hypothetical protein CARUB_v10012783mg [Capsella rubella]